MQFQNFIKNKSEEMKEKPTTILITSERLTICIPDSFQIIFLLKHVNLHNFCSQPLSWGSLVPSIFHPASGCLSNLFHSVLPNR